MVACEFRPKVESDYRGKAAVFHAGDLNGRGLYSRCLLRAPSPLSKLILG